MCELFWFVYIKSHVTLHARSKDWKVNSTFVFHTKNTSFFDMDVSVHDHLISPVTAISCKVILNNSDQVPTQIQEQLLIFKGKNHNCISNF